MNSDNDLFQQLLVKFEAGSISDSELDQFEALIASDYALRDRFLDHTQMDAMLRGLAPEEETTSVVAFTGPTEEASKRYGTWAIGVAALLVVGLIIRLALPNEEAPLVVASTMQSESGATSVDSPLTREERYERSSATTPRGASLAHPETVKNDSVSMPELVEFNRDIRPILSENCFFCHGPDAAERKADLRFDTEEGAKRDLGGYAAIVSGDASKSDLIERIEHADPDSIMPPPESSRVLTETEKALLGRWIDQGATWQKHWSFEPPVRRELPEVTGDPINEVDHFILSKLEEKQLVPSALAEKRTLIRRVSMDLTGLPPTLAEVEAFVADESEEAYERLVDRLLDSDAHAERMAWQWMEVARYADTDGYQNDGPREMWAWRDWVINAYRENLPFDQFTIEQLAGDLLPEPTREQLIATGFNRNHRYNSESGLVLEEFLLENAVDRVDTTMTVWNGLTVGCARCHDHKYDPLSQKDYYRLISFFDNVPESGRAIKFGNSEPWIKAPTAEQEEEIAALKARVNASRQRLEKAEPVIAEKQLSWEKNPGSLDLPVVTRGLSHHHAVDQPIVTDGKSIQDLGIKANGIVPNQRHSLALRITPEQVDEGVVLTNEAPGTGRNGFFIAFHEGHLRFGIITRWIAGVGLIETERTFEAGQSFHLAITGDGTQRTDGIVIYINGEPEPFRTIQNTNSNTNPVTSKHSLFAGGSRHKMPAWKGEIRDLRVYSERTLEAEEAKVIALDRSMSDLIDQKGGRTVIEAATVRDYFLTHAPNRAGHRLRDQWIEAKDRLLAAEDALPTTMIMRESPSTRDTPMRIRGEYHNRGEIVESGVPEVFDQIDNGNDASRLNFANWLVSAEHPLTARVAVNRYWQMLFGTGLVKTAEDFGTQGSPPSHPELLDWMAVEFRESGWDVRAMLRLIVTSRTYRQSSNLSKEFLEADPENVFLARAPRLKLSGSLLRDQALRVSGLMVENIGGPPVNPYQPAGLWKEASAFTYKPGKGEDLYRRSLYTYWKRTLAPPAMAVLDAADREWCSVKPKRTNTPLQALTLMNEPGFFESARKLGERMIHEAASESIEDRVDWGFRALLSREPSEKEVLVLASAWKKYQYQYQADPNLAKSIGNTGDSKVDATLDPVDLATATAVANVLLNLEEASVRE